jgi:hypothetical protein
MDRLRRILLVTAGLSVAGAILGALAAVLALILVVLSTATGSRTWLTISPDMVTVAAADGAIFGTILGPVTAWLALRRVPLGRAMLMTTAGTTAGALLGTPLPFGSYLGAVCGFLVTAYWVRRHARAPELADSPRIV